MSTDVRLTSLMEHCRELRRQGQSVTVEEICRDCPDLSDDLLRLLQSECPEMISTQVVGSASKETTPEDRPAPPTLRPDAEPLPGYRLVKRLGKGGCGEVWEALGPGGMPVALKFVPLAEHSSTVELQALHVIKKIRHPNLLALFGAWDEALLYRTLATLRLDVPVFDSVDYLRWRGPRAEFEQWCTRLKAGDLQRRVMAKAGVAPN